MFVLLPPFHVQLAQFFAVCQTMFHILINGFVQSDRSGQIFAFDHNTGSIRIVAVFRSEIVRRQTAAQGRIAAAAAVNRILKSSNQFAINRNLRRITHPETQLRIFAVGVCFQPVSAAEGRAANLVGVGLHFLFFAAFAFVGQIARFFQPLGFPAGLFFVSGQHLAKHFLSVVNFTGSRFVSVDFGNQRIRAAVVAELGFNHRRAVFAVMYRILRDNLHIVFVIPEENVYLFAADFAAAQHLIPFTAFKIVARQGNTAQLFRLLPIV